MKNTTKKLPIGTKVVIIDNVKDFSLDAGKTKTITNYIDWVGDKDAYCLDGDDGIWCDEDFKEIILQ